MIGLTTSLTGELGETKHVEEWRYQGLKHLDKDVEATLKAFDPKVRFLGIEYTGGTSYSDGPISAADFEKIWQHLSDQAVKISKER
jgi:hypothetical protein